MYVASDMQSCFTGFAFDNGIHVLLVMSVTIGQPSIRVDIKWRAWGTLEKSSHCFSTQPLFDIKFALLQMLGHMKEFL